MTNGVRKEEEEEQKGYKLNSYFLTNGVREKRTKEKKKSYKLNSYLNRVNIPTSKIFTLTNNDNKQTRTAKSMEML